MIGTRSVVMLFIFFNPSMHQLRLNWSYILFELILLLHMQVHTQLCTYICSFIHISVHSLTIFMTLSIKHLINIGVFNINVDNSFRTLASLFLDLLSFHDLLPSQPFYDHTGIQPIPIYASSSFNNTIFKPFALKIIPSSNLTSKIL